MDNGLWIGLLSAFSALAGAGIAQWGAYRSAKLQADRSEQREVQQWEREQANKHQAMLMEKQEEFLGFVLLTETRVIGFLDNLEREKEFPLSAAEQPVSSARQAYAVALLYLDDMHPLAKQFHEATGKLQVVLTNKDGTAAWIQASSWRKSLSAIEEALAAKQQL